MVLVHRGGRVRRVFDARKVQDIEYAVGFFQPDRCNLDYVRELAKRYISKCH